MLIEPSKTKLFTPNKKQLFQNVRSLHLHIDDVRNDYNIQKPDVSGILVNQNFACQIEMMHMIISFVDLRLTEMTFDSLTEELAMQLL